MKRSSYCFFMYISMRFLSSVRIGMKVRMWVIGGLVSLALQVFNCVTLSSTWSLDMVTACSFSYYFCDVSS